MIALEKKRIWELDFLRGLFILGMIVIHVIYDLRSFVGMSMELPPVYHFIQANGGILFILISGICITLGTHYLARGILVFLCGLGVSLVTFVMAYWGMVGRGAVIYWGVLHLLGCCMMLYGLLRYLPNWALATVGIVSILTGYYLNTLAVDTWWLCWLGVQPYDFATGDYFPLFPYLGWFMIGILLGRTVYRKKQTLFPKVSDRWLPIRAISFCGRHSLWIYLGHQPIVYGILMLFA